MLQPKKVKVVVKVKKNIPVERLREVADSLQDVGKDKWNDAKGFSNSDADKRRSSVRDTDNADRYKALADQAEKKSK